MTKLTSTALCTATLLLVLNCASSDEPASGGVLVPPDTHDTFGVTPSNFCAPADVFFVIRRGKERAAIKFSEIRKLENDGTGYATYESYYRRDEGGELTESEKRVGTVSVLGWGGFHPFSYQKGNAKVRVGRITLEYNFPSCISFTPYHRSAGDHGIEIAPTPWTEIRQVNANSPRLQWFRYAADERSLELRREDL